MKVSSFGGNNYLLIFAGMINLPQVYLGILEM